MPQILLTPASDSSRAPMDVTVPVGTTVCHRFDSRPTSNISIRTPITTVTSSYATQCFLDFGPFLRQKQILMHSFVDVCNWYQSSPPSSHDHFLSLSHCCNTMFLRILNGSSRGVRLINRSPAQKLGRNGDQSTYLHDEMIRGARGIRGNQFWLNLP